MVNSTTLHGKKMASKFYWWLITPNYDMQVFCSSTWTLPLFGSEFSKVEIYQNIIKPVSEVRYFTFTVKAYPSAFCCGSISYLTKTIIETRLESTDVYRSAEFLSNVVCQCKVGVTYCRPAQEFVISTAYVWRDSWGQHPHNLLFAREAKASVPAMTP